MKKKVWIILVVFIIMMIIIPGLFILSIFFGAFGHLQSREELIKFKNAAASVVLSVEGEPIGKFFTENRTNISFSQIPSHLTDALIATEDSRFFEHEGIDTRSFFRVLFRSVLLGDSRSGGGSTISQQLAKNMFGRTDHGLFSIFINKTKEVLLAVRLEKVYSKEEILGLYLNTVSFGENVYGIEAASGRYFNKNVRDLRIEESAVLTGMLKANTEYNPRLHPENARNRRNIVLRQMEKYKYLSSSEADSLCKLPMIHHYTNLEAGGPAEYFLVRVRREADKVLEEIFSLTGNRWDIEEDGLTIVTTLSLDMQRCANDAFHDHLAVMQKRLNEQYKTASGRRTLREIVERELGRQVLTEREGDTIKQVIFSWDGSYTDTITVTDSLRQALTLLHAGLLAMDPRTGAVRAWVGGIDFRTQPYDQITARRQLASVFKPFLYAKAFEEGMEPCQYLDNDSVNFSGYNNWSPENYDHFYGGKYSLAGALAQSMNIPSIRLFLKIGFDKLEALWTEMGFSFPLVNTPALALGIAEANIEEVAVAYSSFVNGGFRISPQVIASIKAPDGTVIYQNDFPEAENRVLTERSGLLMSAILQKALREGTGAAIYHKYGVKTPFAGKTGTSQNYADAWFTAFNPGLVMVSRVGASSPAVHFNDGINGSGSALALPLVALTLKKAESDPGLTKQFYAPFPGLPPELEGALDCPDFKEKNFLERFLELFEDDEVFYNEKIRKRYFLRRIFRR